MKEITIQDFDNLEDATWFLEEHLAKAVEMTDEVDGEIKFINNNWRVGIILNNRQVEFNV